MIVEWLMTISAGFIDWVATLFPPVELPEWVEDPFEGLHTIAAVVVGIDTWVDVLLIAAVTAVGLGVYVTTAGVKLLRAVLAHVPLIGGNG